MKAAAAALVIGREPERAKVMRAIYSTLAGHSAVCLLEGTIGSGKSTLAAEARARAQSSGLTVIPIAELATPPGTCDALPRFGPGPYCLVADDLPGADAETRAALERLLDHSSLTLDSGPPVLILATASLSTDPLTRRLALMASETGTRVTLRGVTLHELRRLLHHHGHRLTEDTLAAVHSHSAGNPGLALRLAERGAAPDSMEQTSIPHTLLRPELEQMAPCLRGFLEVLAVDGGDAPSGQTADVARLALEAATRTEKSPLDTAALVDALNPVLSGNGREVRLNDRAWRDVTVALIEPAKRQMLHGLLAERTSGLARARHLSAASPEGDPALADTFEAEAISALDAGRYSDSAGYLALAMSLSRGPERSRRLVDASLTAGLAENPEGVLALFGELGRLEAPAQSAYLRAGAAVFSGRLSDARRLLQDQLRTPQSTAESRSALTRWRMLILLSAVELSASDAQAAHAAVREAYDVGIEPATPIDKVLRRTLALYEAHALWDSGAAEEAIVLLDNFLIEVTGTAEHTDALYVRGRAHYYAGRTSAALEDLERAEQARHHRAVPAAAQRGMAEQAMIEFQLGRWTDAILRAERVIAMARDNHDWQGLESSHVVLAMAAVAHADETAAAEHTDWLAHHVTTTSSRTLYNVMTGLAWSAKMAGDHERTLELIRSFRRSRLSIWTGSVGLIGWRALEIEALLDLEDPSPARLVQAERLLADFSQEVAARPALPLPYGHPQALRAKLAQRRGDLETAVTDYQAALWLAEDFPHLKAQLHYSLGVVHRERGEHVEADQHLEAARNTFAQLGASAELTKVKSKLLSVAGRYASLTPRERDIAHLVSQGRTNREIAESLFVSRKTVEYHVSNLLPKLKLGSRRELWTSAAVTSRRTSPPERSSQVSPGARSL